MQNITVSSIYTRQITFHTVHNDTHVYRSTCVVFFASTLLCTYEVPQFVYACMHEMYLQAFFDQVALCA